MPIYEFACPKCRVIFNFFSQRVKPERLPKCPRCGNKKMERQISAFAFTKGAKEAPSSVESDSAGTMPNLDDPKVARALDQMEREMPGLDQDNPRHLAQLMRKMKDLMPKDSTPRELEAAIKRLEAGEDPEKIEADMGDVLGDFAETPAEPKSKSKSRAKKPIRYTRDSKLYDY